MRVFMYSKANYVQGVEIGAMTYFGEPREGQNTNFHYMENDSSH